MEWYTKPFKVIEKKETENGLYTNCYLYYVQEYEKDGEKKKSNKRIQVPKSIYDRVVKGNTVQLVRVEFYHKEKEKYLDFISDVNIQK